MSHLRNAIVIFYVLRKYMIHPLIFDMDNPVSFPSLYCSYDIMTSCWNMESRKRPTFIVLEKELSNLLEVYAGYIELSST